MSLLDGTQGRRSPFDYLSLKRLLIASGLTFGLSTVGLILVSVTTFTGRDEQGHIMNAIMLLTAAFFMSGVFLVVLGGVALIRSRRDQ